MKPRRWWFVMRDNSTRTALGLVEIRYHDCVQTIVNGERVLLISPSLTRAIGARGGLCNACGLRILP